MNPPAKAGLSALLQSSHSKLAKVLLLLCILVCSCNRNYVPLSSDLLKVFSWFIGPQGIFIRACHATDHPVKQIQRHKVRKEDSTTGMLRGLGRAHAVPRPLSLKATARSCFSGPSLESGCLLSLTAMALSTRWLKSLLLLSTIKSIPLKRPYFWHQTVEVKFML